MLNIFTVFTHINTEKLHNSAFVDVGWPELCSTGHRGGGITPAARVAIWWTCYLGFLPLVGVGVGLRVGMRVGKRVGLRVGMRVGKGVGLRVGDLVGLLVGFLMTPALQPHLSGALY